MPILSASNLVHATPAVTKPGFDRTRVTPGIVHLGIGAFHRAHMAVYLDDLLGRSPDWGIVGASLRRPVTRDALAPQDFLYTLAVRDAAGTRCRVIGALLDVIDARDNPRALLEVMASPAIRIVSLTVTEKGYCHDPATGRLDATHPDIVHDLANRETPRSAPGFIVAALAMRKQAGVPPFTVMSCDNLPANGKTTARIVTRLAALWAPDLGRHVADHVAFPSTMVDRIVPATAPADRAMVSEITGLDDAWPIMTEPFTQWVIEDRFPAGRPAFEAAGAQLVSDVTPFEKMKLRMLNGSHSTLAYLGYLAGHQYVADAIAAPEFRALINGLMTNEAMATLRMPGTDLGAYRDQLLARFANPALQHRTWQIAMDGSQKLPQRFLGTITDLMAAGQPYTRLALGVAAWMRYATGVDEQGKAIEVKDPLTPRFSEIAATAGADPAALVDGFLGLREVFSENLRKSTKFHDALTCHLANLMEKGAAATVAEIVTQG